MNKGAFGITIGSILASAAAIAQLRLTLAIVVLVIGTCVAGATALAQIVETTDIDERVADQEQHVQTGFENGRLTNRGESKATADGQITGSVSEVPFQDHPATFVHPGVDFSRPNC